MEDREEKEAIQPLKDAYLRELVQRIKANELVEDMEDASKSWASKLNPFKDGKSE